MNMTSSAMPEQASTITANSDAILQQLEPIFQHITDMIGDISDDKNRTYRSILSESKDGNDFIRNVLTYEPAEYFRFKANFDAAAKEISFPFVSAESDEEDSSEL